MMKKILILALICLNSIMLLAGEPDYKTVISRADKIFKNYDRDATEEGVVTYDSWNPPVSITISTYKNETKKEAIARLSKANEDFFATKENNLLPKKYLGINSTKYNSNLIGAYSNDLLFFDNFRISVIYEGLIKEYEPTFIKTLKMLQNALEINTPIKDWKTEYNSTKIYKINDVFDLEILRKEFGKKYYSKAEKEKFLEKTTLPFLFLTPIPNTTWDNKKPQDYKLLEIMFFANAGKYSKKDMENIQEEYFQRTSKISYKTLGDNTNAEKYFGTVAKEYYSPLRDSNPLAAVTGMDYVLTLTYIYTDKYTIRIKSMFNNDIPGARDKFAKDEEEIFAKIAKGIKK